MKQHQSKQRLMATIDISAQKPGSYRVTCTLVFLWLHMSLFCSLHLLNTNNDLNHQVHQALSCPPKRPYMSHQCSLSLVLMMS